MLEIDALLVSQESVDRSKIEEMIEYVRAGGIWSVEAILAHDEHHPLTRHGREQAFSPLIAITRFEDGTLMVQNGHHRVRATRMFREHLYPEEYIISDWTIADYSDVNFERTYVTPYDPRTQIRLLDFGDYKRSVLEIAANDIELAHEYIRTHAHEYCKDREVHRVMDMLIDAYTREEVI